MNCTSLTSINIPDSVTTIENYAFYYCSSLPDITITNVETIGSSAFSYCAALQNISIPNAVTIGPSAFSYCTTLKQALLTSKRLASIAASTFYGCLKLNYIIISSTVMTDMGDYAFFGCNILPDIRIPDTVTSIGAYAFGECIYLTSVTLPRGTSDLAINTYAFESCIRLSNIVIPESVTYIGPHAFQGCKALTSATFNHRIWTMSSSTTTAVAVSTNAASYLTNTYVNYTWTKYIPVKPVITVSKPVYASSVMYITVTNNNALALTFDGEIEYYFEDGYSQRILIALSNNNTISANSSKTYTCSAYNQDGSQRDDITHARLCNVNFKEDGSYASYYIDKYGNIGGVASNGLINPFGSFVDEDDQGSTDTQICLYAGTHNYNSGDLGLSWHIIIYDDNDEVIARYSNWIDFGSETTNIYLSLSSSIPFDGGTYEMYFEDSEGNETDHIFGSIGWR
jgi:hypothetical protein